VRDVHVRVPGVWGEVEGRCVGRHAGDLAGAWEDVAWFWEGFGDTVHLFFLSRAVDGPCVMKLLLLLLLLLQSYDISRLPETRTECCYMNNEGVELTCLFYPEYGLRKQAGRIGSSHYAQRSRGLIRVDERVSKLEGDDCLYSK